MSSSKDTNKENDKLKVRFNIEPSSNEAAKNLESDNFKKQVEEVKKNITSETKE